MTVFTSDYVIVKGDRLISWDKLLLVKRFLRMPLRLKCASHLSQVKKLSLMLGNSICCPATTYCKKKIGEPLIRSDYSFVLDWENMLRLAERPGRWICEEKPLLCYRVHDGAATKACIRDHRREQEERDKIHVNNQDANLCGIKAFNGSMKKGYWTVSFRRVTIKP